MSLQARNSHLVDGSNIILLFLSKIHQLKSTLLKGFAKKIISEDRPPFAEIFGALGSSIQTLKVCKYSGPEVQ